VQDKDFFDNRIEEQDTTSLVTVLLVFECLLFMGYVSERKDITYGKHKMLLDISAIKHATCHNILHLFEFIHTLFSFHFFFFFLLSLYFCIPSLIALHKQTMNFIYMCSSLHMNGSYYISTRSSLQVKGHIYIYNNNRFKK
jgi:hypothetical protein